MDYTREQQALDIMKAFTDRFPNMDVEIWFDDDQERITVDVYDLDEVYVLQVGSDDDSMVFYNMDDGDDTITVPMTET